MSPRKPVYPLNYFCIKTLSNQLIHALSDEEGAHFDDVANYMVSATFETLQDLLKEILGCVNLDASTRFSCLEILLREDLKKLDTGIFPRFYYDKILVTIAEKGKRLQYLNLKGVWVRDYPDLLNNLIQNLTHLKSLVIPHMADDSVITSIFNLKNLTMLDISGEACYSCEGIRSLKSDSIRVLDIGNFGKPDLCQDEHNGIEIVAEILENLPNLSALKTYSFTGHALLLLYRKNKNVHTKLGYLYDTGTTMECLEAMAIICPNLENLHLNCPEEGIIEECSRFKRIHSLKLTKGNGTELKSFLYQSGSQLQVLKLNHNKNYLLNLSELCLNTPNLSTLECFQMKLIFTDIDTYFMSLQNIEILYCDISDSSVKFLMINSPFLRRIVIGCEISMTDGDIFRLCAESSFENLEELWFSYARSLTATSVELLMGHCPNLKVLGQLSGWDMHQEELDYLRVVITVTNTDLTLLPVNSLI